MLKIFRKKQDEAQLAMDDLLAGMKLPSFPALVMEVLSDLRDPDLSLGAIAGKLERDPGLTVQILRTVNTAAFGLSREVTNLHTAVSMTGHARLETILLTHSVKGALPSVQAPNFSLKRFWTVAAQRACLARQIASRLHPASQNEAFTAGLLLDMAVPVFVQQRNEAYTEILTTLQDPAQWPHELETDRFSFDHTDLGGHMARQWQLPAYLVDAISGHHQDDAGTRFEPGLHLASLVRDHADPVALLPVFDLAERDYGLDRPALELIMTAAFAEAEEFAHKFA